MLNLLHFCAQAVYWSCGKSYFPCEYKHIKVCEGRLDLAQLLPATHPFAVIPGSVIPFLWEIIILVYQQVAYEML